MIMLAVFAFGMVLLHFTMIEFGAGYARWATRGWIAARRRGLAVHLGVVEAEPQHAAWARSHLAFNGVPDTDISFFEAAVGTEPGETVFLVEMPEGNAGNNAREWYGQAVSWAPAEQGVATQRTYCGHPLVEMPGGWVGLRVEVQTLTQLGMERDRAEHVVALFAAHDEKVLVQTHAFYSDEKQLLQNAAQWSSELEGILENDRVGK
eukprot:gene12595-16791_t